MDYAFLDLETTGLVPWYHEITEIAIKRGSLIFVKKIKPERMDRADSYALKVSGYNKKVWEEEAVPFSSVANEIVSLLKNVIIVGHNVNFDINFLKFAFYKLSDKEGKKNPKLWEKEKISLYTIDTMSLALEHLRPHGQKSVSLKNVCNVLGISNEGEHTAYADVLRTEQVFYRLLRSTPEDHEELKLLVEQNSKRKNWR